MRFDHAVRDRGFRRWYERQLIESHAWLVSGLLALILTATVLETIGLGGSWPDLLALVAIGAAGCAVALFGWRQFSRRLFRAEHLAGQAVCRNCNAYARFSVVDAKPHPDAVAGFALDVACRQCGHRWTLG